MVNWAMCAKKKDSHVEKLLPPMLTNQLTVVLLAIMSTIARYIVLLLIAISLAKKLVMCTRTI